MAKAVLARGVANIPTSYKLWIAAARLEADDVAKSRVLRRALERIPGSVRCDMDCFLGAGCVSSLACVHFVQRRMVVKECLGCIGFWFGARQRQRHIHMIQLLRASHWAVPHSAFYPQC